MDKRYSQEAPKQRSFLSAIFGRKQSRSASSEPPPYESITGSPTKIIHKISSTRGMPEDALEFLRQYDTVILVDDSQSMTHCGSTRGVSRWCEARQALQTLAEIAHKYDEDGIDIHFLNAKHSATNIRSSSQIHEVFDQVKPSGMTPTGDRLDKLLKPYLTKLETADIQPDGTPIDRQTGKEIKRINYIVITDGVPTDDPKNPIVDAATRLKAIRNLSMVQLGIQFVQIGNDEEATRSLKMLDDDLSKESGIWDIVDTTPYSELSPVTGDGLVKALLGGINRRVDAQNK
ncbi:hypothetical protein R3P38DRAFT_2661192 [Favolaschia claudopus]|uniref:VWFA domain-containing protein n=1 Tax=Favolaschia claudopus TaxID=2862362 RepID=A0AAV9ZN71_9AGAR